MANKKLNKKQKFWVSFISVAVLLTAVGGIIGSSGLIEFEAGEDFNVSGTLDITENGTHDVSKFEDVNVNVPIPDGYIKPNGTLDITENGNYDITDYTSVNVNLVEEELLQLIINNQNNSPISIQGFFKGFSGENADFLKKYDFSKVGTASNLFNGCPNLKVLEIPESFNNVLYFNYLAKNCPKLEVVKFLGDTSKCTSFSYAFDGCSNLTTIENLDCSSVSSSMYFECMLSSCRNLTNLFMYNIKVDLTIGGGGWYSDVLSVESLINTCKELVKTTGSRTLTMGSVNLEKIANIYVKFVDPTQTTIEVGTKGDVVVCESTDSGAMTLTEYASLKQWTLK